GGSGGGPAAAEARSSVAPTGSLPPADDAIPFAPADGAGGRRSGASFRLSSEERFAAAAAAAARYQRDQLAHQRIFADKRARLLSLIEATRGLVRQVQDANAGHCSVRLPVPSAASPAAARDAEGRRGSLRAPESGAEIGGGGGGPEEAAASCPDLPLPRRPLSQQGLCRRGSEPPSLWGSSSEPAAGAALQRGGLQVLNLDLKMGNTHLRSSLINPESVSSLFDERLAGALAHLDALTQRVADSSSKILVTGDLNAGKSTFVNALLRREILPVDQQPCTTLFCEVLDATQENGGAEEIHAVPVDSQTKYDRADPRTYVKVDMRHLEKLIDNHHRNYSQLKVYCGDRRSASESLLHNGIVNIALVDSPGLNRDSLKTTALFARQQEIDVVVFVVSAENHFTLSVSRSGTNPVAYRYPCANRF
ncbi:MAG: P-loop containing nucleoside triphosphate hydrolase protein, partial [Olpidium bornovanus]